VLSADSAGFEPLTVIGSGTTAVNPFVFGWRDEFEIFDSIVEFVAVSMMNLESVGNLPVSPFPLDNVGKSQPAVDNAP
jgi:hypothetical protein